MKAKYCSWFLLPLPSQMPRGAGRESSSRNKHAAHDRAWPKTPRLLLLARTLPTSPWLLNYRACFQLSHGGPWDIYSWLRTGLDRGGDFLSKSGRGSLFFWTTWIIASSLIRWNEAKVTFRRFYGLSMMHSYFKRSRCGEVSNSLPISPRVINHPEKDDSL